MNNILLEDYKYIATVDYIPWDKLAGKTILVTGAYGLIGSVLVGSLLYANEAKKLDLKIIALGTSRQKFESKFTESDSLKFIEASVESLPEIEDDINFIVHAASPTASRYFVEHPVETINIAVNGTRNMLELAKEKNVKSFVYLSSMEVYGHPQKGHKVKGNEIAGFDTTNARNSYPLGKQLAEMLCSAYFAEYNIPAKVVRLTQTFGSGVEYNDNRVFAEFMRCAVEKRDIMLKTKGETERCYLYTADAVTAILTIMLKGESGQAYTAANSDTYCSIMQMAQLVATEIAKNEIKVIIDETGSENRGFADTLYMDLSVEELCALGWKPNIMLAEMYRRMIGALR